MREAALALKAKLTDYELEVFKPVVNLGYILDPRYKTKNLSEDLSKMVCEDLRKILELVPSAPGEPVNSVNSLLGDDSEDDESTDELEEYLRVRREKSKAYVLNWWKFNQHSYPKLAFLAQRLLPIQATSVASERVFSIAVGVDTKSRNRLSDVMVENIVLFKSWIQFLHLE